MWTRGRVRQVIEAVFGVSDHIDPLSTSYQLLSFCSQSASSAASRFGKSNLGVNSVNIVATPTPDVQPIIDELATYCITVYAQGSNFIDSDSVLAIPLNLRGHPAFRWTADGQPCQYASGG